MFYCNKLIAFSNKLEYIGAIFLAEGNQNFWSFGSEFLIRKDDELLSRAFCNFRKFETYSGGHFPCADYLEIKRLSVIGLYTIESIDSGHQLEVCTL